MENTEKTEMKTLSSCMSKLKGDGFKDEYTVKGNLLESADSGKCYTSDDVKIVNFYRFEGDSDPSDNAILYALQTEDGQKGLLINAYGMYSDGDTGKFIVNVKDINKKMDQDGPDSKHIDT